MGKMRPPRRPRDGGGSMTALPPLPLTPDAVLPAEGLPIKALVERMDPAARAAFYHERRRGWSEIEALALGVFIPDAMQTFRTGRRT